MSDTNTVNNELMHPVLGEDAWSESYYFNFIDPKTKLGMFTRMGFRPHNGWADALHVIYLEGKRVAFTYGRRDIGTDLSVYDGDLKVGGLNIICQAAHKQWQLIFDGPAQDIANASILLERSKLRPAGWFTPAHLRMDLNFDCLTPPHFAAAGERGHFEQSGRITGTIQLDDQSWQVDGYGVRDKSWGPRDWGASGTGGGSSAPVTGPAPFINWFSMNFGAEAALGGSCFRHADGVIRGEGWYQSGTEVKDLKNVVITSEYEADSIIHTAVVLTGELEGGEKIEITGKVHSVCPTKIPMAGGATFVNEGLAEFTWNGKTGFGIAEHWHAIRS
ncbi:MAG: hypothetical protein KDI36_06135 [Pseudomonadales bacterium]|nr:hypothetical protein [Pseudomonadales bacterium]